MSVKLDLMRSGVITLPGGIDTSAHLLFVFPSSTLSLIHIRFSGAHLMTLVQQYLEHVPASLRGRGFSFLIDMTTLTKDSVQVVVETVEKIECENPHLVSTLYVVAPRNKDSVKMLKKLTSNTAKSSKKAPARVSFQTVVVNSKNELNDHIDVHQRTPDYGGTLRYNHTAYVKLVQTFQSLEEKIGKVQYKLSAAQDKLLMLQEYEIPSRLEARELLLTQITNKYHDVMRDLNIESCIDECRVTIEKLRSPEREPEFSEIMMSPLFGVAKDKLELKHRELTESREQLQALWQLAEERVSSSSKLGKYKAKAEKVVEWLDDIGFPTVRQEAEVGDCLSKAELYKHHFEAGFHSVAQNVIWLSEKIIKKMEGGLLQDKQHSQDSKNLLAYSRTFHSKIGTFRKEVEAKRQLFENVHQFFLVSDKHNNNSNQDPTEFLSTENIYKMLSQLSVWYERSLKCLPLHLLQRHTAHSVDIHQVSQQVFYPTEAWVRALENYLMYNPCPKAGVLAKLKNILPVVDNLSVRNQARILVHRVEVLSQVMSHPKLIPTMHQELTDIVRWKESVQQDMDDVLFELTSSGLVGGMGGLDSRMPARFGGSDSTGLHQLDLSLPRSAMPSTLSLNRSNTPSMGSLDGILTSSEKGSNKSLERPKKPRRKNLAIKGYKSIKSLDQVDGDSGETTPESNPLEFSTRNRDLSPPPRQPIRSQTPSRMQTQADKPNHLPPQQRSVTPGALKQQMLARAAKKASVVTTTASGNNHYGSAPNIATGELRVTFEDHFGAEDANAPSLTTQSRSVSNPHIPKLDLSFLQSTGQVAQGGASNVTDAVHDASFLMRQNSYKVYGESRRKLTNSSTSSGSYLQMDSIPEFSDSKTNTGEERYVSLDVPVSPLGGEGKSGKTKRTRSASPKYYAKLLANEKGELPLSLTLSDSGGFDLTQENVETVVKSKLPTDDKLTIMSSMCEVNGTENNPVLLNKKKVEFSKDLPKVDFKDNGFYSDLVSESTTSNESGLVNGHEARNQGKHHTITPNEAQIIAKQLEQVSLNKSKSVPANRIGGINRKDRKALKKKSPRTVKSQNSKLEPEEDSFTTGKSSSTMEDRPQRIALLNKKATAKIPYGIDIKAWIDKQKHADYEAAPSMDSSVEVTSSSGAEALDECKAKFQQARANRLHEEQLLEKERQRLHDLEIEQQAAKQVEVERALKRTERILQEQEQKLQHDSNKRAFAYKPQAVASGEPPVVHIRTNSTGNASEESGIFTQTSQDSAIRAGADGIVMVTHIGQPQFAPLSNRSDPQSSRDEITYSSSKSDWDSAFDNATHVDVTMIENADASPRLTNGIVGHHTNDSVRREDTAETSETEESQCYGNDNRSSDGDLTTTSCHDEDTENIIVSEVPPSLDLNNSEMYATESNSSYDILSPSNGSVRYGGNVSSTVTDLSARNEISFDSESQITDSYVSNNTEIENLRHGKSRQSSTTRRSPLLPRGISPGLQAVEISLEDLNNHQLKSRREGPVKNNFKSVSTTKQLDFRDMLKKAKKDVRSKRTGSVTSEKDLLSSSRVGKSYALEQIRNEADSKRIAVDSSQSSQVNTSQVSKSSQGAAGSGIRSVSELSEAVRNDQNVVRSYSKENSKSHGINWDKSPTDCVEPKFDSGLTGKMNNASKPRGDGLKPLVVASSNVEKVEGFREKGINENNVLLVSGNSETGGGIGELCTDRQDTMLHRVASHDNKSDNVKSNTGKDESINHDSDIYDRINEVDVSGKSNTNRALQICDVNPSLEQKTHPGNYQREVSNVISSTPRTPACGSRSNGDSQKNEEMVLERSSDKSNLPCLAEEDVPNETLVKSEEDTASSTAEMSQGEVMIEGDLNDTMLSSIMGFDHDQKCTSEALADVEDNDTETLDQSSSYYKEDDEVDTTEDAEFTQEVNDTETLDHSGSYYEEDDEVDTTEDAECTQEVNDTNSTPELEVYSYMQDLQDDVIEEEGSFLNETRSGDESSRTLSQGIRGDTAQSCVNTSRRSDKNEDTLGDSEQFSVIDEERDGQTSTEDTRSPNRRSCTFSQGNLGQSRSSFANNPSRSVLYEDITGDFNEVMTTNTSQYEDESLQVKGLSTLDFMDFTDLEHDLGNSEGENNVLDSNKVEHDLNDLDNLDANNTMTSTEDVSLAGDTVPTDTCLDDSLPSDVAFMTELGEGDFSFEEGSDWYEERNAERSAVHLEVEEGEGRVLTSNSSGEGHVMLCSRASPSSPACVAAVPSEVACFQKAVIIDNGSGRCKCGFAGEEGPAAAFPAYVGRPKYNEIMSKAYRDTYVGEDAQNLRGMLQLKYPLEHGIITDWNDMELIWSHAFDNHLRIDSSEHPVLLTEAPLNPKRNRERMMEMMFETFQAPAIYVAVQAVMALYASGRTTGVVLDVGDGVSHTVPVYEGYSLPHAIQRLDLAGRDLTHHLVTLMYSSGHSFTSTAERDIARDIKEKLCYVAEDYRAELLRSEQSAEMEGHYRMPDGRTVTLGQERFKCCEALFDPSLLGREHGGIQQSLYNAVNKCDIDLRRELLSNVVLSGGSTLFEGLPSRLQSELSSLYSTDLASSVKVTSAAEREFLVWQGASVLANMESFQKCWVLHEEYREYGAEVIHRKCF